MVMFCSLMATLCKKKFFFKKWVCRFFFLIHFMLNSVIIRKIFKCLTENQWKLSNNFLVELASKPCKYIYDIMQRIKGSDACHPWYSGAGANGISQMHPVVSKCEIIFQLILIHHAEQRYLCCSYWINKVAGR